MKAVLPYLTTIVTSAIPAFTAKKDDERIAELQKAVRHNAESAKILAEQMQRAIQAIESGAGSAERSLRRAQRLSVLAIIVAVVALGGTFLTLWGR